MAVEPDLNSEVYREFDVRVVDNEERYFCLLPPCVDKNKSLSNRQHWITHRKFVHKEKDNINLPSGRVIRKWLTERAGYQPLGRVTASVDRRMISAPSIEEGNTKTYNLVVHISGLMTQLGSAWEELARVVQDTNQSIPQAALPRIVAEKVKELYLNLERGTAIGGELPRKPDESKGRKRRRKRDEQDVEGDPREWGSMGKALAGGMHYPKLLKPLDSRESHSIYHAPHENEHSLEEGVLEDSHDIHAMGARVSDVGWSLAALAPGLRSDGSAMGDVDRGDGDLGGMHVDRNDVGSRLEDLVPAMGIGMG
ncbi:uncharacterized protein [Physcomitrium patens]|uniref:Uncharacterized protein n=1 Tax=Physcomitrium patens TaxID=3218 RepID=A0A2K1JP34_PHYPA|nr:uncharacterized protein LOC112290002 [Physcomitrium patens]XP_024391610.1 uncharacterized protein LOC112290002 [Physcomitrium patens]XP_024391611.1 uncharacterized protein LOC112290002 [Physcomitrium patens]XP_024391654.1 uncharacterized protein LOC112290018 [Physcomitrium patens]XP_024391655.1 uncharacterized protein LOC112290018 [Physcomitrium patens]XP_024391657.1 uncharacterized protein LOC112290018 [Physcomitrium patens]XP_024391658.1 uncharacterized protein LOC112290018 [Physcomitriu|eukprot:XP_024391609.1 uncharacterized protein LOC112290002 [Physcomitrella patens]